MRPGRNAHHPSSSVRYRAERCGDAVLLFVLVAAAMAAVGVADAGSLAVLSIVSLTDAANPLILAAAIPMGSLQPAASESPTPDQLREANERLSREVAAHEATLRELEAVRP